MADKKDLTFNFPKELEKLIKDFNWEDNTFGYSGTFVFKLTRDQEILYLKINQPKSDFNLEKEKTILEWLERKLPVPTVLYFDIAEEREFLLLSEVEGTNSHIAKTDDEKITNIKILAEGLKMIHSINLKECPIDNNPNNMIEFAKARLQKGDIDPNQFDERWKDKEPKQLLEELVRIKPTEFDLVFSHGDYCLPNILIRDEQLSGFIDWPYGGVNDRYFDLAAVAWSIGYNYGEEWVESFFNEYGIKEIEWERIYFYQRLNEFFQQ
ncbi:MAG: aminoglycoside 3'-phosphotransferase [Candidatus Heimdallarchaeota archaeon]|nr:aminoglycoside 3'-phosphotransferase [Candidatus Heimdallarchaeota archaeon]